MLGAKLWQGAELYCDPEIACGRGYNNDRGPVAVYALRVHAEF